MGANQINTEILEALGVPMKNVCGAYLVLAPGVLPKLTVQTILYEPEQIGELLTKFTEYTLVAKDPSGPTPRSGAEGEVA